MKTTVERFLESLRENIDGDMGIGDFDLGDFGKASLTSIASTGKCDASIRVDLENKELEKTLLDIIKTVSYNKKVVKDAEKGILIIHDDWAASLLQGIEQGKTKVTPQRIKTISKGITSTLSYYLKRREEAIFLKEQNFNKVDREVWENLKRLIKPKDSKKILDLGKVILANLHERDTFSELIYHRGIEGDYIDQGNGIYTCRDLADMIWHQTDNGWKHFFNGESYENPKPTGNEFEVESELSEEPLLTNSKLLAKLLTEL